MFRLHRLLQLSAIAFFCCSWTAFLNAQLNRGVIEGIIMDAQGGAMSGVNVAITSADTNVSVRTKTNSTGYYRVEDLVPGHYIAHFSAAGFAPLDVTKIEVPAGEVIRVGGQLRIGTVQQAIEVQAGVPLVETSASNFSTTLQGNIIQNVPLAGRDLQQLTYLLPGVNNVGGPPGSNFGFNSEFGTFPDPTHLIGSQVAVNGGQSGANAWYLDGNLNISDLGENIVVDPSPDAVSEFQAITNAFSAEYGHTGGAVFNVVLKSGTKDYHGDVYEYLRNSFFNARNPFASIAGINQTQVRFNNFGGTLGGPVIIPHLYNGKNKTFFFFSYDQQILHQAGQNVFTVPTPLMRQGNFSEDPNVAQYGIYDPYTTGGPDANGLFARQPFINASGGLATSIPKNRLDPTAMFFVNSFPLPNHIDTLGGCPIAQGSTFSVCNNYVGPVASSQDPVNLSLKIDHQSGNSHYFAEWLFNPTQYENFVLPWTGPTFPQDLVGFGSPYNFNNRNQIIALGHTYTFSPTLLNEFRASFSRQFMTTNPAQPYPNSVNDQSAVEQRLAGLGLPSNFFYPTPHFEIDNTPGGGYIAFGPTSWTNMNTGAEAYTLIDNVTKVVNKHTLKAGFMYRLDHGMYESDYPTAMDLSGSLTQNAVTGLGGNGLAQFELGAVPADGTGYAGHSTSPYTRWRSWAFYIQDDFHVTRNLTLNFGLRYDLNGFFKARNYPMANFCFTCINTQTGLKGQLVYEGSPNFPNGDILPANHNGIAPRLNFAWSPLGKGKTVIRGGYDIFYTDALANINAPGQSQVNASGWGLSAGWDTSYTPQCVAFAGPCVAFPLSDTSINKTDLLFPSINGPFPAQVRGNVLGGAYAFTKPPRDPMVANWTFEIQQQLPGTMMISAGYIGNHGSHLAGLGPGNWYNYVPTALKLKYRTQLFNSYPITQFYSGKTATQLGLLYADPITGAPATSLPLSTLLLPYPFFAGGVNANGLYRGSSDYDALDVKIQKRFSHGLDFLVAYTWSKEIDTSVGGLGVEVVDPIHYSRTGFTGSRGGELESLYGGPAAFQDPDNVRAERAVSVNDIPRMLNIASTYDLPIGTGKALAVSSRLLNGIAGGWKVTGNLNAQDGLPLTITCPPSTLQSLSTPGVGRCNLVGDPNFSGSRTKAQQIGQWLNPAAFEPAFGNDPTFWANYDPTDPRAWTFGNMGPRSSAIRSPGFWNLDASLMKEFHFTEARYLEFRWEVFNALNHQNLGLPNTGFCLPPNPDGTTDLVHQAGCTFGRITNVQTDPRAMEFALKFFF